MSISESHAPDPTDAAAPQPTPCGFRRGSATLGRSSRSDAQPLGIRPLRETPTNRCYAGTT